MDKVKRERSANFSLQERDILVSLILKYQTVIENKQSDATTWRKKEAAWESIQSEFNARSGGPFRSTKTLKVKYEGLKRTVRKKSAAIRSELYRTGGGKNTATPLDTVEEQVKALITLNTDGLESTYDSDVLPMPQTLQGQDGINVPTMEDFMDISMLGINVETGDVVEVVETEVTQNNVLLATEECEAFPPSTSAEIIIEEKKNDVVNANIIDTPSAKFTPTSANKKWDVSSRRNLKTRKHPALIGNVSKSKLDELTQAKLELVQLQKSLIESEIIEKKRYGSLKKLNARRILNLKKRSAYGRKRNTS